VKIAGTLGPTTNILNDQAIGLSAVTSQQSKSRAHSIDICVFHRPIVQSHFGACPSDSMAALFRIRVMKTLAERGKVRSRL